MKEVDEKTKELLTEYFAELRKVGYDIKDTYYFVNNEDPSPEVIKIILKYIPLIDNSVYKEGLIKSISVKGIKDAVPILLNEYRKSHNSQTMWIIGNALWAIQDNAIADEIIELLDSEFVLEDQDGSLENTDDIKPTVVRAKETLLWALGATKDKKAIPILKKYLTDELLAGHALEGLKYFKDPQLIPDVKSLLKHEKKWVRDKAKRYINRLEKLK